MHNAASRLLFEDEVARFTSELLQSRQWTILERTHPVLSVLFEAPGRVPFRVRMECDNWNDCSPAVALLDKDGVLLQSLPTGSPIFNSSAHPVTGKPFVCMAGIREYHTHSSHLNDLWDNYKIRAGYDLGGILSQLWSGWLKTTP